MKIKFKVSKQCKKTQRDRVLEYLLDGGILTDYNGVQIGYGTSIIRTYYIEGE